MRSRIHILTAALALLPMVSAAQETSCALVGVYCGQVLPGVPFGNSQMLRIIDGAIVVVDPRNYPLPSPSESDDSRSVPLPARTTTRPGPEGVPAFPRKAGEPPLPRVLAPPSPDRRTIWPPQLSSPNPPHAVPVLTEEQLREQERWRCHVSPMSIVCP